MHKQVEKLLGVLLLLLRWETWHGLFINYDSTKSDSESLHILPKDAKLHITELDYFHFEKSRPIKIVEDMALQSSLFGVSFAFSLCLALRQQLGLLLYL